MRDYTQPPTEEFAMITRMGTRYPDQWLTLMKSVMNDYWFDQPDGKDHVLWGEPAYVDLFMHKIYYCWQQHFADRDAERMVGDE
tara:strand:+ start:370 stop:621 length:252 start_codon:yes stop_codon:yes gene_type:complete